MSASGDSCFSLYDLDQVVISVLKFQIKFHNLLTNHHNNYTFLTICNQTSTQQESKPSSEVNFQLCCYDDASNRDELERLHHTIAEVESENGCNRLLITKLEDELLAMRRRELRTVSDTILMKSAQVFYKFFTRNTIAISKPTNLKCCDTSWKQLAISSWTRRMTIRKHRYLISMISRRSKTTWNQNMKYSII